MRPTNDRKLFGESYRCAALPPCETASASNRRLSRDIALNRRESRYIAVASGFLLFALATGIAYGVQALECGEAGSSVGAATQFRFFEGCHIKRGAAWVPFRYRMVRGKQ